MNRPNPSVVLSRAFTRHCRGFVSGESSWFNSLCAVLSLIALGSVAAPHLCAAVPVAPAPAASAKPAAAPSLADILRQARSYIGPEAKVAAIKSLRYKGEFDNVTERVSGDFQIWLTAPNKQRTEFSEGTKLRTTATDGIEAWTRVTFKPAATGADQAKSAGPAAAPPEQLRTLSAKELARLKYDAFDNLHFFNDLSAIYGKTTYIGKTFKDGFECYRVRFEFDENYSIERYFNTEDGQLVATVSTSGVTIREYGEIITNGLRFPRVVDAYLNGDLVNRIVYSEIAINEDLPDVLFEYPVMGKRLEVKADSE